MKRPSKEIFVEAGPRITVPILREAKSSSDKASYLLNDMEVKPD